MSLNTAALKNAGAKQAPSAPTPAAAKAQEGGAYILLELKLYKRYLRHNRLYEKTDTQGKPKVYKFTPDQAKILLEENDNGRAIWRRWRPVQARPRVEPKPRPTEVSDNYAFEDATKAKVVETSYDDPVMTRIDIGEDEEIADVLESLKNESHDEGSGEEPFEGEEVAV